MVPTPHRHANDEQMEKYSMGSMSADETADFEEHLLICPGCQERLSETDAYIASVRTAGSQLQQTSPVRPRVTFWRWAGALAAAAAIILVLRTMPSLPGSAPAVVELQVSRGSLTAAAPARTAVRLRPDLTGLPAYASYVLELVDEGGTVRWQGQAGHNEFPVLPGQKAGTYFVRVYSPARELLREYALQIGH